MKKIIKAGKYIYKMCCDLCKCEFVYEREDIEREHCKTPPYGSDGVKEYVTCPCCGEKCTHGEWRKIEYQNAKPRNGEISGEIKL